MRIVREPSDALSPRKRQILKAVVEAYIRTGEPVGSKYLMQNQQIGFSSATIRNEMAELAEMGYLDQPHTSAGRVPSAQGYKFYVNELMNRYSMTNGELDELSRIKREKQAELDQILEDAGKLVSLMTNYTSVTVRPRPRNLTFSRFDGIYLDEMQFILVMTTSAGDVKTKNVRLNFPITKIVLRRLMTLLNYYVAGQKLESVTLPIIMKMETELEEYGVLVNPIIKTIYEVAHMTGDGDIRFEGMNKLLQYPEFSDVERIREMFDFFERKDDILSLVEHADGNAGVSVYIGNEGEVEAMENSALVFKTLTDENGNIVGAIGVVGPARMDYARVVTLVDTLTGSISQMLALEERINRKKARLLGNGEGNNDGNEQNE